mgnify:CR=1 FL=1
MTRSQMIETVARKTGFTEAQMQCLTRSRTACALTKR